MLVRAGFVVVLVLVNVPGFRPVLARDWHRVRHLPTARLRGLFARTTGVPAVGRYMTQMIIWVIPTFGTPRRPRLDNHRNSTVGSIHLVLSICLIPLVGMRHIEAISSPRALPVAEACGAGHTGELAAMGWNIGVCLEGEPASVGPPDPLHPIIQLVQAIPTTWGRM
jgi:hypothetical protein